jgi:hypothetical protein
MITRTRVALRTRSQQVLPSRLNIADGGGAPLPPERDRRLAPLVGELEAHGFVPLTTVTPDDPETPTTTFARVLVHPEEAISAWAIDMARGTIVRSYVELTTEWEDDTVVSTVNHSSPTIFETLPRLRQVKLPGAGVTETVAAHREACAGVPGPRIDPAGRSAVEVAQAQNREVLAYQAERGLLCRRGEDYGFTLRGAFRSVGRVQRAVRA